MDEISLKDENREIQEIQLIHFGLVNEQNKLIVFLKFDEISRVKVMILTV